MVILESQRNSLFLKKRSFLHPMSKMHPQIIKNGTQIAKEIVYNESRISKKHMTKNKNTHGRIQMKIKMKKIVLLGLAIVMVTGVLAGCGNKHGEEMKEPDSGVGLEVEVIYTGEPLELFRKIVTDFTAETGIEVELVTPGADYETVMKTRMGSGEMPDVFVTHGWSLARYKEYLTPMNNQKWYDRIDESVLPVISDDDANIYVLPVTQIIDGMVYNKTVLEKAGVNPGDIRTMDDFKEACEKIKAIGVTPYFVGGKESWTAACAYNKLAPGFYTAEGAAYSAGESLIDGTFDWNTNGAYLLDFIAEMVQKGYFNTDFVTADSAATLAALGEGRAAFSTECEIVKVLNVAPDAKIGMLPTPSTSKDGKSLYAIGEGSCFGIWKDSKCMEAAEKFLNYLATPEIANRIMEIDGGLPALSGMNTDNITYREFKESQALFGDDLCYDNVFDRKYFPNGMFNAMGDAVIEVFMNPDKTGVAAGVEVLRSTYADKYEATE